MKCSIEGCEKDVLYRGLCKKHYWAEYRTRPGVKEKMRKSMKKYMKKLGVRDVIREYNREYAKKRREVNGKSGEICQV